MDHLPPAPTPPVNNGAGSMASNSDRTANLLNLLKFSGSGSSIAGQRQPQQGPQPQSTQQQSLSPPAHSEQHSQHQSQIHSPSQDHHDQGYHSQHQHIHQHQSSMSPGQYSQQIHQPAPAAADPTGLLAALMRGAHEAEENKAQVSSQVSAQQVPSQPANTFGHGSPPPDTRSYLLNLLNRPKPGQDKPQQQQSQLTESSRSNNHTPGSPEIDQAQILAQYKQSNDPYAAAKQYQQAKMYGDEAQSSNIAESYSYSPGHQQQSGPTDVSALYQQLMGSLAQSSPQSTGGMQSSNAGLPYHILKKDQSSPAGSQHLGHGSQYQGSQRGSIHSPVTSPHELNRPHANRAPSLHSHQSHHSVSKPTPTSTTDYDRYTVSEHHAPEHHAHEHHEHERHKETVSDAISDIAAKADQDARDALDRAEYEQTQSEIAEQLDRMLDADSDGEFHHSAQAAAEGLKKELDRSDNEGVLEAALPADVAESVRDIVDEAAQGVADSWESADQEEIVVIEEKEDPPVKVFNFPMKPWIAINLNEDSTDPRPEFRDEAIMDIARLKKDFDQIDRNLYTASTNYMTYGMSKQGGLRVIRQDDGKDAKAFTDTKDRIFNVAMSVTPSDYNGPHKEAIIGTGISGTVYWVQVREGEKDHIEDTHLEQYGFALPPMNSLEGDAPGGVLKTRARASTIHPEFFAVGRGKSINFIWPTYIMQNQLFKPGHDRVVDTDRLYEQCSLKINTGKAGKDFTFSQDDTVVVSLDKSGRVKFWDVRDLTAVKEGSDPRHPVPAQSSLEVKEPLMTLASTPEGEKAWPTSVLLLDKQRPYQKRCALRYMIVGMKQNHTLQLWDLALGKPVQEFNLPHSKESDAVCSVMYHPSSGMIVIGHPTRNSIYFAHLSAPKYNLKSVSQAEYIQRLVAQDSSIPQPDSTAVISGVREYSFENRGILRSLDILGNPAMVQDTDEPTLFELYAMHSKGVACLLIKQRELGWSKDNKVLAPVDAVAEGIVAVSKLKTPQPAEVTSDVPPQRNGARGPNGKEAPHVTNLPAPNEPIPRAPELATPVKAKSEIKDIETPVHSSKENHPEKPERKPRKKKGAANHGDIAPNGSAQQAPAAAKETPKGVAANGVSSETLDVVLGGLESRISTTLAETLKSSLRNLHNKIDDGVRVRDENFNQHQLKLLDMVSDVLNDNTQKVLEALIHHQFTELVIPAIGEKAGRAVSDILSNNLQPNITAAVQKEIQQSLPHALSRSLRSNDFIHTISDRVSVSVASSVQQEVLSVLTQRLTSTFSNMTTQSAQRVATELHQQYHDQFEHMKAQRAADSNKIDQLMGQVRQLTDMVSTMATSQQALQAEFLKLRSQQPVHELPGVPGPQSIGGGPSVSHGSYAGPLVSNKVPSHQGSYAGSQAPVHGQYKTSSPQYGRGPQYAGSPHNSAPASEHTSAVTNASNMGGSYASQMTAPDDDLASRIRAVEQAIAEGRLQDAMIQWIQSGRDGEIFQRCLSRYHPSKFESLPPLMLLVVIATIAKDLKPNPRLKHEVDWIEMAVRRFAENMTTHEWDKQGFGEVMKSTSQTMQLLINRLKPLVDSIHDEFPTDPFLASLERHKLETIIVTSEGILEHFGGYRHYE